MQEIVLQRKNKNNLCNLYNPTVLFEIRGQKSFFHYVIFYWDITNTYICCRATPSAVVTKRSPNDLK